MINDLTTIRIGTKDDLSFILDSWIKTAKYIYPNQYVLDFNKKYNEYLNVLIEKSTIIVSCIDNDPKDIVSYLVYSSFVGRFLVIHFAYTKVAARKEGIISSLINFANPNNDPVVFTHAAKNENIMKVLCLKYIFDPSVLGEI